MLLRMCVIRIACCSFASHLCSECDMPSIQDFALALPEDIPDSPHQPVTGYKFPKCSFGKKTVVNHSFMHSQFLKEPFLHYNQPNDIIYCYTCLCMFTEKKAKSSTKVDQAFVSV